MGDSDDGRLSARVANAAQLSQLARSSDSHGSGSEEGSVGCGGSVKGGGAADGDGADEDEDLTNGSCTNIHDRGVPRGTDSSAAGREHSISQQGFALPAGAHEAYLKL